MDIPRKPRPIRTTLQQKNDSVAASLAETSDFGSQMSDNTPRMTGPDLPAQPFSPPTLQSLLTAPTAGAPSGRPLSHSYPVVTDPFNPQYSEPNDQDYLQVNPLCGQADAFAGGMPANAASMTPLQPHTSRQLEQMARFMRSSRRISAPGHLAQPGFGHSLHGNPLYQPSQLSEVATPMSGLKRPYSSSGALSAADLFNSHPAVPAFEHPLLDDPALKRRNLTEYQIPSFTDHHPAEFHQLLAPCLPSSSSTALTQPRTSPTTEAGNVWQPETHLETQPVEAAAAAAAGVAPAGAPAATVAGALQEEEAAQRPSTSGKATASRQAVSCKPGGTSQFRGVTKHRWTGKWEAHLWDSSVVRKTKGAGGRSRGKQVYLGGYDTEEAAARAYDRAAIVYWGESAQINFMLSDYAEDLSELRTLSREEVVAMLRRGSSGFSRGASRYRGVTRHHQHGKWEARIGRVSGSRYMYLGTFEHECEAAMAYDLAATKHRGAKAVTNFQQHIYTDPDTGCLMTLEEVLAAFGPKGPMAHVLGLGPNTSGGSTSSSQQSARRRGAAAAAADAGAPAGVGAGASGSTPGGSPAQAMAPSWPMPGPAGTSPSEVVSEVRNDGHPGHHAAAHQRYPGNSFLPNALHRDCQGMVSSFSSLLDIPAPMELPGSPAFATTMHNQLVFDYSIFQEQTRMLLAPEPLLPGTHARVRPSARPAGPLQPPSMAVLNILRSSSLAVGGPANASGGSYLNLTAAGPSVFSQAGVLSQGMPDEQPRVQTGCGLLDSLPHTWSMELNHLLLERMDSGTPRSIHGSGALPHDFWAQHQQLQQAPSVDISQLMDSYGSSAPCLADTAAEAAAAAGDASGHALLGSNQVAFVVGKGHDMVIASKSELELRSEPEASFPSCGLQSAQTRGSVMPRRASV